MATFNTPCVIAVGVSGGRVIYLDVESGKKIEEKVEVSLDSVEPEVRDFVRGHVALASFSSTTVKGVALSKQAYLLDASGLRPLSQRAVSLSAVKNREYGSWEHVWNTPIFLSNTNPTIAIGASRAGTLLHINAVPSSIEVARKAWVTARILQRIGELSLNCVCRLGLMPYEILARRGSKYVVARFYLNTSRSERVLFIVGEGGNVVYKSEVSIEDVETAAYEFITKLQ